MQDILKKEDGAYVKYALSHMVQNDYQVTPEKCFSPSVNIWKHFRGGLAV
jgi:hypothetical protein